MAVFTSALMPMGPNRNERTMLVANDQPETFPTSVVVRRMAHSGYDVEVELDAQPAMCDGLQRHIYRKLLERTMVSYGTNTSVTMNRDIFYDNEGTSTAYPWASPTSSSTTTIRMMANYGDTSITTDNTDYFNWHAIEGIVSSAVSQWFQLDSYGADLQHKSPTLTERMREIIRARKAPGFIIKQNDRRKPLPMPQDVREQRARETMRRVLGNTEYRRLLAHGFVSIKAKSGLVYQIFTGHGVTCVFNGDKVVERLCVVLRGTFCPTDSLMMRYLMILNDEEQFRKLAIKHGTTIHRREERPADNRSLLEIFQSIKKVA